MPNINFLAFINSENEGLCVTNYKTGGRTWLIRLIGYWEAFWDIAATVLDVSFDLLHT